MIKRLKKLVNWFEKNYALSWIIVVLIAILIFYMSSKTFEKGPGTSSYISYVYHFFIFFLLAFFLSISMTRGENKNRIFILIAVLIAISYGISDELHQFFVPGRNSSLNDFLTNSSGVLTAGVFYTASIDGNKE